MLRSYSSREAAHEALKLEGFHPSSLEDSWFWVKPSRVDPAAGGHESAAVVSVEHRRVDPEYDAPDFFEVVFH